MAEADSVHPYLQFLTHAHAYDIFVKRPFEAYSSFRFPRGLSEHVQEHRQRLRQKMLKYYLVEEDDGV